MTLSFTYIFKGYSTISPSTTINVQGKFNIFNRNHRFLMGIKMESNDLFYSASPTIFHVCIEEQSEKLFNKDNRIIYFV